MKSHQICRVWLKKQASCPFEVLGIFAGKLILWHLEPSYLVQSKKLLRLTADEILVLMAITTFEKFRIDHFFFLIPSLVKKKLVFENYFLSKLGEELKRENGQF